MDTFSPQLPPRAALWETVAGSLRRAIILGGLPAGLRLEEPALAQKFGVSRIPIREAIAQLRHEGLVRVEAHRGAYVVGFTEEDLANYYACRRLIELHAVREAALRPLGVTTGKLQPFVDEYVAAFNGNRRDRMPLIDQAFHREIVILGANRFVLSAWEPIAGLMLTIAGITSATDPDLPHWASLHQLIVDALERRDPVDAEGLLSEHLRAGKAQMLAAMLQAQPSTPERV